MALIYDVDFNSQTRILSLLDKAGNVISSCEVPSKEVDDITKPLTFRAKQDGSTVKLTKNGSPDGAFQTSRDGGKTWVDYSLYTTITLNTGDEVSFRAKVDRTSAQNMGSYFHFEMTGKIEAWHNVMSLYRTNDFATYNTVVDYAFTMLFYICSSLTKAPALPATTLADSCYYWMFYSCSSLTKAPALPATTLVIDCYFRMFDACKNLTKVPELPATTLARGCYKYMFSGCSSLNEVRCHMPSSYSASNISSNYATDWLSGVASTGTFYTNADANWTANSSSGIPQNWTRVNEGAPAVDDPNKPLMLRAIEDNSSVTLTKNGTLSNTYQTSTNGTDWTDYTLGTKIILNKGESVYFRCSNHPTTQDDSNHVQFVMTGKVEAWHNAYSMISSDFSSAGGSVGSYGMFRLFRGCASLTKAPLLLNALSPHCYASMFHGCKSLTSAPQLPATTLADRCYYSMFYGCTSLTSAPQLPATTLADRCYYSMFYGCTSLTSAPQLPATTLAEYCYGYMFEGCTSLTSAPQLPATTLAEYCYGYMFEGCTSLTSAPQLPATTLADRCYYSMFEGCTSLTSAPQLPATTLAYLCYGYMFKGCSKLKEVRISATTTASDALINWLSGVSATGDFYCDPNATIFPTDNTSGIPSGWNRRDINLLNALTLTATADNSSVKLTKNGTLDNTFEVDTGNGWEGYAFGTVIPLNAGQSCKWRCKSHPTTQSDSNYVQFVMTGKIEASGNVNSMLSRGFENLTSLSGYDYAFKSMFNRCTSLVQAPELPATNLATYCYGYMFYGCTSLVQAPELPATTLATNCYTCMFNSCTSLVQAPELPATTLATYCYYYMFNGCTSLVQAPELPATNLATYCYGYMFRNCTSLTQAPSLPATALAHNCYAFMFYGCTSLVQAPELPATTLANFCYEHMFTGCTPLNEVRISATTTATGALNYWLAGVSATGDFYCDPNATIFQSGDSGIPANWTRHALADYPVTP